MQIAPKPISNHRFARLTLWVRLSLVWFGSVLAHFGDCFDVRAALAQRVRTVANLLFIAMTMQLVRRRFRQRTHGGAPRPHAFRDGQTFVLKHVRRLLRGKSIGEQIAVLSHLVKHRDEVAAQLVEQLLRAMRTRPRHSLASASAPLSRAFAFALRSLATPAQAVLDTS